MGEKEASEKGEAAFLMDGKVIDAPVVAQARQIIVDAQQCGSDTVAVMGSFKGLRDIKLGLKEPRPRISKYGRKGT